METQAFLSALSIVSTVCAIFFGYAAFQRNKKMDSKDDVERDATVLTEIGYIKGGIDDIKAEQREQCKTNTDVLERLSKVEASAKQAHHRLDSVEKEVRAAGNL